MSWLATSTSFTNVRIILSECFILQHFQLSVQSANTLMQIYIQKKKRKREVELAGARAFG